MLMPQFLEPIVFPPHGWVQGPGVWDSDIMRFIQLLPITACIKHDSTITAIAIGEWYRIYAQ